MWQGLKGNARFQKKSQKFFQQSLVNKKAAGPLLKLMN
jgi:hypothetical protein